MNKAEFCTRSSTGRTCPARPLAASWTFCSPRPASMTSASGGGGPPLRDAHPCRWSSMSPQHVAKRRTRPPTSLRTKICCAGGFDGSRTNAGSVHVSQVTTQPGMTGSFASPDRHECRGARSCMQGCTMFVAERRWEDFCGQSRVRTDAQARAEIEFPRARGPFTAGCQFSPATKLRSDAPQSKRSRSLVAFGGPTGPDSNTRCVRQPCRSGSR